VSRISKKWSNEEPSAPFIIRLLRKFRPRKISLKRQIGEVIYRLDVQMDKLDETLNRLRDRDKELLEKTVKAYIAKDFARATIYANEVAELRKMAKIVLASRLALEKVKVRLETIRELGDVAAVMAPIIPILKGLKSQLAGIIPEISVELEEITNSMNSMLMELGQVTTTALSSPMLTEEAKRVLLEAQALAEEKIRENFPKIPPEIKVSIPKEGAKVPIPSALTIAARPAPSRPAARIRLSLRVLEEKVLEYIRAHRGFIDVNDCARIFGVQKEDVLKALKSLERKGKIRLKA